MNEAVNVNRRIAKAAEKARERARQRSDGLAVGVLLTLAVFVHYAQRGIG